MATHHEIVGDEWKARAPELADWAMQHLVNRKDVWGQYSVLTPSEQRREDRTYKAMTLPQKDRRGADMVTLDKLTRHFASRRHRKPQIIGLHAKSEDGTSKWLGIDIDCHDTDATAAEDHARRNLVAAIKWWKHLQSLGYDPMLFDSNGAGGYHLWILFAEPAPTTDVFAFAKDLVARWQDDNLDEEPETFPKRFKPDSLGSWFRIPGLHHTRDHYGTLWSGDEWLNDPWLSGHAAIDVMLSNIPGPPPPAASAERSSAAASSSRVTRRSPKADVVQATPSALKRRRDFPRSGKARVCVDLDGVLCSRQYATGATEFGEPIDGAREFMQSLAEFAHTIIYTSRLGASASEKGTDATAMATAIKNWLDQHHIDFAEICTDKSKPIADAYVDDRAVSCRPEQDGVAAFATATDAVIKLCT
ncbi:MAG: hypothetical protein KTR32_25815 [Granulosicoccus sp.]|nr:hypothetical protein [Granulosicoccus sp.]